MDTSPAFLDAKVLDEQPLPKTVVIKARAHDPAVYVNAAAAVCLEKDRISTSDWTTPWLIDDK